MPYNHGSTDEDKQKWTVLHGMEAAKQSQTRFTRIPDNHLNAETVAGIRDMNLGRVKADGSHVGGPTIRFDTGSNSGARPHININPRGRSSRTTPHIEVPRGVVRSAQVINRTLKYASIGLTVCTVAIDAWRLGSAIQDDIYIQEHAPEIIEELEDSIKKLKNLRKIETNSTRQQEIDETIGDLEKILKDVKRTKVVPVKTIKTTSSIAGGWGAGVAGGYGGALAGAEAGAAIGTLFGPIGPVVGGPVGAMIGAFGGSMGAGIAGSMAGEYIADKGIETFVDP